MKQVWKDSPEWATLGINEDLVSEEAMYCNVAYVSDDWSMTEQSGDAFWYTANNGTWLVVLSNWGEDHALWASGYTLAKVFDSEAEWRAEIARLEDIPETLSWDGELNANPDAIPGIGHVIQEGSK